MIQYDIAIMLINSYIAQYLPERYLGMKKDRFKERSYARWAVNEILTRVQYEFFDVPDYISGRSKPSVEDIIDDFILLMEHFLRLKYVWMFDVGKNSAIGLKRYLSNANELDFKKEKIV